MSTVSIWHHCKADTPAIRLLHIDFDILHPSIFPGVWVGHYLQFWKGILHIGWACAWWRAARDKQEKCTEGDCCSGLAARGQ